MEPFGEFKIYATIDFYLSADSGKATGYRKVVCLKTAYVTRGEAVKMLEDCKNMNPGMQLNGRFVEDIQVG